MIMDVIFNHKAEGNEEDPILSFRGVDNSVYYMFASKYREISRQFLKGKDGFSGLLQNAYVGALIYIRFRTGSCWSSPLFKNPTLLCLIFYGQKVEKGLKGGRASWILVGLGRPGARRSRWSQIWAEPMDPGLFWLDFFVFVHQWGVFKLTQFVIYRFAQVSSLIYYFSLPQTWSPATK